MPAGLVESGEDPAETAAREVEEEPAGGAQAADLADRALPLTTGDGALDPRAALEAAKAGA